MSTRAQSYRRDGRVKHFTLTQGMFDYEEVIPKLRQTNSGGYTNYKLYYRSCQIISLFYSRQFQVIISLLYHRNKTYLHKFKNTILFLYLLLQNSSYKFLKKTNLLLSIKLRICSKKIFNRLKIDRVIRVRRQ